MHRAPYSARPRAVFNANSKQVFAFIDTIRHVNLERFSPTVGVLCAVIAARVDFLTIDEHVARFIHRPEQQDDSLLFL